MPLPASSSPRFLSVVGARPNLVKMAAGVAELRRRMPDARHVVVHTGQHYDPLLSDVFIGELGIPPRDHALNVGSGSHAVQTARVLERLEPVLVAEAPDLVFVPGDVNSTLTAARATAIAWDPSRARRVRPQEFRPDDARGDQPRRPRPTLRDSPLHSDEADDNLRAEGIRDERLYLVGNTIIDTLVAMEPRFRSLDAAAALGVRHGEFLLVTLHRPALVDGDLLGPAIDALGAGARASRALSLPSADTQGARRARDPGRRSPARAARLPRVPLSRLRGGGRAHGLPRGAGGDDVPRRPMLHAARKHRAAGHDQAGDESAARARAGVDPGLPALLATRGPAPVEPPPLWDGRAAERVVERVVDVIERIGNGDSVASR